MDWRKLIIPFGILLLNLVVKILFIDATPIGGDEPFTIYYAQHDYGSLFQMFESENNPPLYTLIMKYWIHFFGIETFSVRLLPLLFSSFAAVVIYKIGCSFHSNFSGILAALIFTFSSYHVYFAHESRPYALFALLTAISMLLFLQVVIQKRKRRIYLLALVNILLIYTHFFGFFVLFAQFLAFLLITPIRKELWKPLIISWIITFVGYLPYLPLLMSRFGHASGGTWLDSPNLSSLYTNLWKFSNQPVNTVLFLALLATGLVIWIIQRKGKAKPQYFVLVIWFLVPYLLMFALSFKMPMFLDRYLVFISIAFYLLIAISVDKIFTNDKIRYVIGIALVALMIFTCDFKSGNLRQDDAFVAEIIKHKTDKTAVILCPEWYFMTFSYHYSREYFADYSSTLDHLKDDNIYGSTKLYDQNVSILSGKEHIIFVNTGAEFVDPTGEAEKEILRSFDLVEKNEEFAPFTISYYRRR
ncbi:MAG: mannosyltransferase [Crocinitomicaceae bacterium]|jgi:mannosyltransferase